MKKFIIGLLKAIGYFAIYLVMQLVITVVFAIVKAIPVAMKYALGGSLLSDPAVFSAYMDEVIQIVMDTALPAVIVSGVLTVGLLWLIFACRKKKFVREVGIRKMNPVAVAPLVLMGLSFNILTSLMFALVPQEAMDSYTESSSFVFSGNMVTVVIATVIMAPIVEEIVFRGLVYTRLKKGMPAVLAMILASTLFGLAHGQWLWMIYTSVFGMVLVWVYERTKSLFASMLLHFGYNLCPVLLGLLPADVPDWMGLVLIAAAVVVAALSIFWFVKLPKGKSPEEPVVAAEPLPEPEEVSEEEETAEDGSSCDEEKATDDSSVGEVAEAVGAVAGVAGAVAEIAEAVIENI